jgi:hypothetical protein
LDSVSLLNISGQTNKSALTENIPPFKGGLRGGGKFYTGSGNKLKSYYPYKNTSPNPSQ